MHEDMVRVYEERLALDRELNDELARCEMRGTYYSYGTAT